VSSHDLILAVVEAPDIPDDPENRKQIRIARTLEQQLLTKLQDISYLSRMVLRVCVWEHLAPLSYLDCVYCVYFLT
jgi:hypothetical protein